MGALASKWPCALCCLMALQHFAAYNIGLSLFAKQAKRQRELKRERQPAPSKQHPALDFWKCTKEGASSHNRTTALLTTSSILDDPGCHRKFCKEKDIRIMLQCTTRAVLNY